MAVWVFIIIIEYVITTMCIIAMWVCSPITIGTDQSNRFHTGETWGEIAGIVRETRHSSLGSQSTSRIPREHIQEMEVIEITTQLENNL